MKAALNELPIKAATLGALRKAGRLNRRSILSSEYALGRHPCRADLAVWDGRDFIGIEVKSARDNLLRLPAQLRHYRACFDRVVIVADAKHIRGIFEIAEPADEIWTANSDGSLHQVQTGESASSRTEVRSRLELLKLPELRSLAGISDTSYPRSNLMQKAQLVPAVTIKAAVISSFCKAYEETSANFWAAVGRRTIKPAYIAALSPFAAQRRRQSENKRNAELFWGQWHAEADVSAVSTFETV